MRLRPNRTLIFAFFVALGTSYYYFDLLLPRARLRDAANDMIGPYAYGGDFYPIWLTGRELIYHGRNPYTQAMTREIQTGLFGRPMDPHRPYDPPTDFRAFSYPLYADLLAAPLLPLEFNVVRVVLAILLPLLTAASLALWLRAFQLRVSSSTLAIAIVLLLVSYPVLEGLFAQQAGLLVGAALAMSTALLIRERLILSGMLLAFASVKPQLVWLLALWLLLWAVSDWKQRKGFVLSFIFTMALLVLVSQLILPGWLLGWWSSLVGYSRYTLPPLTQLVLGRFLGIAAGLALLALAAAVGWRTRRQPAGSTGFALAVSSVLAVSVMLAPTGGAVYDQVILLPAICWLGFRRAEILNAGRPMRVLALAALVALCWQWLVACGVALASLVLPGWASSPAVLVFPTRMAAPLPFALLALLSFFAVKLLRGQTGASTVSLP
jgi:Glycosyltransferase family 87